MAGGRVRTPVSYCISGWVLYPALFSTNSWSICEFRDLLFSPNVRLSSRNAESCKSWLIQAQVPPNGPVTILSLLKQWDLNVKQGLKFVLIKHDSSETDFPVRSSVIEREVQVIGVVIQAVWPLELQMMPYVTKGNYVRVHRTAWVTQFWQLSAVWAQYNKSVTSRYSSVAHLLPTTSFLLFKRLTVQVTTDLTQSRTVPISCVIISYPIPSKIHHKPAGTHKYLRVFQTCE
jgi:hypothetical protein